MQINLLSASFHIYEYLQGIFFALEFLFHHNSRVPFRTSTFFEYFPFLKFVFILHWNVSFVSGFIVLYLASTYSFLIVLYIFYFRMCSKRKSTMNYFFVYECYMNPNMFQEWTWSSKLFSKVKTSRSIVHFSIISS